MPVQRFDCLAKELPLLGPHFLEASAGTGKTFAVEHIVARLLLNGIGLEEILVVTFTRAATRELKLRIRSNLEKILSNGCGYLDPSQALHQISDAVATFDRCQIYTIHGFCFRMLKEFAFEIDLPLSLKEKRSSERLDALLSDFLETKLSAIVSPEQLELFLRTTPVEDLVRKLKKGELPETARTYSELHAAFCQEMTVELEFEKLKEDFAALQGSYRKKEANFEAQLKALAEKKFGPLIREKGTLFTFLAPDNKKVKAKEPTFLHYPAIFDWGREKILPLIESAIEETLPAILSLWKPIERKFLAEAGVLGPDELLQTMSEAIRKESFREKVQKKYRAVLIDEFQDTDPLQWEIFRTLFYNRRYPKNRLP